MRFYVVLLTFMFSLSLLFAEQVSKAKGSIGLGLVNGASIGLGWDNANKPNRDYYVNAVYYQGEIFWYAGINHETRFYLNRHFYAPLTVGVDYLECTIADKYGSSLFPHLTIGIGGQVVVSENIHLYIEWDLGIKPSVSNINIGLSF
ncbi:MAG: hypothetical protein U1B83_10140 [Candidatus Cloacimonadaceae bacterium]|nr:hypothetical protein [Candidatus Cloacimonadaceae bacterium]